LASAVVHQGESLSYGELNARANRLAHHLRALGVGPDMPAGICAERSLEMVVGVLGIVKAGGAYVPLDPAYPPERLGYMIGDSAPAVVLMCAAVRPVLEAAVETLAAQTAAAQASTAQASAVQASAVQASAVQASAVQASAVQASAVQASAVQASAVQA